MKSSDFEILNAIEQPIIVLDAKSNILFFENEAALTMGIKGIENLENPYYAFGNQVFKVSRKAINEFIILQLKDISRERQLEEEFDQFIRIASHDLREPARKISNFGEKLAAELNLEAKPKLYLERMLAASERMQQMLHDLLLLYRIKLNNEKSSLDFEKTLQEISLKKGIELILKSNLENEFNGEATLLIQLLTHLLDNVAKFKDQNQAEANIEIVATSGMLEITISDNGIGMTQVDFEEAKKPFVRLNGRSEYDGTGIGLAIANKIIQILNGEMALIPTVKGTKIKLTIPVKVS